jgi:transcriptional regulator with XRE-family HTH domain
VKITPGRHRFGMRFELLREAQRLTQTALAEQAGIPTEYIAQIERGERTRISVEACSRLARALGVSFAKLRAKAEDTSDVMTREHPAWSGFVARLQGSGLLDVHLARSGDGQKATAVRCQHSVDFSKAMRALTALEIVGKQGSFDKETSREYFQVRGARCDCEILTKLAPELWGIQKPSGRAPRTRRPGLFMKL